MQIAFDDVTRCRQSRAPNRVATRLAVGDGKSTRRKCKLRQCLHRDLRGGAFEMGRLFDEGGEKETTATPRERSRQRTRIDIRRTERSSPCSGQAES